jgi:phenylacetic acid degradation operon negative regulatory protein
MMRRWRTSPRSLILDLFGDYLRYADAEVRLSHLTTLPGAFDIASPTVRVTMSRLRREHWFTTHRVGREMIYRNPRVAARNRRSGWSRVAGAR